MKRNNLSQTPTERLNQREQALAKKHYYRLQQMTERAIQAPQKKPLVPLASWIKPTFATAFSILLITTVVFLYQYEEEKPLTSSLTTLPELPVWIADTDIPVTLIENIDFYHWLSQQTDNQHAKNQQYFTMALNGYTQHRLSQRLRSRDVTKRLSRTAIDSRSYQK